MALGAWVGRARSADALDFVEQGLVSESRPAQFGPVAPAPATDHVVYGGERKALVIQVAVLHGFSLYLRMFFKFLVPSMARKEDESCPARKRDDDTVYHSSVRRGLLLCPR